MLVFQLLAKGFAQQTEDYAAHILEHVRPQVSEVIQQQAALEVIARLLPQQQAEKFRVTIDSSMERNSFSVSIIAGESKRIVPSSLPVVVTQLFKGEEVSDPSEVQITASSGVAATKAFYHYLRYWCRVLVAWEGSQLNLPAVLPPVNVTIQAPSR